MTEEVFNGYDFEADLIDLNLKKFTRDEIYALIDMQLIPKDFPEWFFMNQDWDSPHEEER